MSASKEALDKAEAEARPIWDEWLLKSGYLLEKMKKLGFGNYDSSAMKKEKKALDAEYYPKIQAIRRKYGIPEPQ